MKLLKTLILSFAVILDCGPLPAAVVLPELPDPATSVSVAWDGVDGATNYNVYAWVGLNPTQPTNAFFTRSTTNVLTLTKLLPRTGYSLRLNAQNAAGIGGFSTTLTFIVPQRVPIFSVKNGIATVQGFVFQPTVLQSSTNLISWTTVQNFATNQVNTYTCPATNKQQFFRFK